MLYHLSHHLRGGTIPSNLIGFCISPLDAAATAAAVAATEVNGDFGPLPPGLPAPPAAAAACAAAAAFAAAAAPPAPITSDKTRDERFGNPCGRFGAKPFGERDLSLAPLEPLSLPPPPPPPGGERGPLEEPPPELECPPPEVDRGLMEADKGELRGWEEAVRRRGRSSLISYLVPEE